jgi:hypothetical protein
MNILLVEPNYRSTFPPLGLLRISAFLKTIGIEPKFVRGMDNDCRTEHWDKVYISSLFTFELPRTVKTINYYKNSVTNPYTDIIVGGVGATLMPEYITQNSACQVFVGPLCDSNMLGMGEAPIASFTPDYDILKTIDKKYVPESAYFTRVTTGCIRKCAFCAVPVLEPKFDYLKSLREQIEEVDRKYGPKRDLIVLDNNILALKNVEDVLEEIKSLGFEKGSRFNGRKRNVDFNQGIDARLITPQIAQKLGEIAISPVRVAFDHISVEKPYRQGVKNLARAGIRHIMTYVMFNFQDTPEEFYARLRINMDLAEENNLKITSFPMKYCPIDQVDRHYISPNWNWRYLRGIQCILNATHGVVSTNPKFFNLSFGSTAEEFKTIVSMPDNFIIYRSRYADLASQWKHDFELLNGEQKSCLFDILKTRHDTKLNMQSDDPNIKTVLDYYDMK